METTKITVYVSYVKFSCIVFYDYGVGEEGWMCCLKFNYFFDVFLKKYDYVMLKDDLVNERYFLFEK